MLLATLCSHPCHIPHCPHICTQVSPWYRITITRAVAIVPTLTMALLYRSNTSELDRLNQYLNLLQSIQLPFALTPVSL